MDLSKPEWISALANLVMAFGILLVWYQSSLLRKQLEASNRELAADHERSRRELTLKVLQDWNQGVSPATAAAEKLVERLNEQQCKDIVQNKPLSIRKEHLPIARAVLGELFPKDHPVAPGDEIILDEMHVARIRFILAEYLNTLETTFASWQLRVVDTKVLEDQFEFLLSPQHGFNILEPFRRAMGGVDCYPASYAFMKALEKRYHERAGKAKAEVA